MTRLVMRRSEWLFTAAVISFALLAAVLLASATGEFRNDPRRGLLVHRRSSQLFMLGGDNATRKFDLGDVHGVRTILRYLAAHIVVE